MSANQKFEHFYHIYERSSANKKVYRCIHPDCAHYIKRELLGGKRAECPKCHELFILTWTKLRLKKPTCDACSRSPRAAEIRQLQELSKQLTNEIELPEEIRSILE